MVVNVDEEERIQGVKEAQIAAARRLSASDSNPSRIQEGQGSDVSPMDLLMNSSTKLKNEKVACEQEAERVRLRKSEIPWD